MFLYTGFSNLCDAARAYRQNYPDSKLEFYEDAVYAGYTDSKKPTMAPHVIEKLNPTCPRPVANFLVQLLNAMGRLDSDGSVTQVDCRASAWKRVLEPAF